MVPYIQLYLGSRSRIRVLNFHSGWPIKSHRDHLLEDQDQGRPLHCMTTNLLESYCTAGSSRSTDLEPISANRQASKLRFRRILWRLCYRAEPYEAIFTYQIPSFAQRSLGRDRF